MPVPNRLPPLKIRTLRSNPLLAVFALAALAVSLGFWYWSFQNKTAHLSLSSGVELRYRKDLTAVLCEEAAARDLQIDIQSGGRAAEWIERVDRGELDAAIIPAGLAMPATNVRQVAMLECEVLHLFVKPELLPQGIAGLKGRRINLGASGTGVRIIAGEILQFIGMKPGDYEELSYSYADLIKLPPQAMPDAVFGLSPLPAPLGERLVQQYGYGLMDLPFAEAVALRKPYIEDTSVPANTYGVHPAVPEKPLHTVGTRAVLVAHSGVSKAAIRSLLEVLYESDFARRVGMRPLDAGLLERSGEYPNHAGTTAYLHRHDPWISKDFVDSTKGLLGMIASAVSAVVLAWQWFRRRVARIDAYLRQCSQVELAALRAAARQEFGEGELQSCLTQLARLKVDALEKHQEGFFPGDQQFLDVISRIEALQRSLPEFLVAAGSSRMPQTAAAPQRRAG